MSVTADLLILLSARSRLQSFLEVYLPRSWSSHIPQRASVPMHVNFSGSSLQELFFISRSLAMTSTGSVWPVAFWISGSCFTLS